VPGVVGVADAPGAGVLGSREEDDAAEEADGIQGEEESIDEAASKPVEVQRKPDPAAKDSGVVIQRAGRAAAIRDALRGVGTRIGSFGGQIKRGAGEAGTWLTTKAGPALKRGAIATGKGIGKGAEEVWRDALDLVTFVGRVASVTLRSLAQPRYLRIAAVARQVEETGVDALPIIGLMAIMISIVIGYQASRSSGPTAART
jgi:hypothetical protein